MSTLKRGVRNVSIMCTIVVALGYVYGEYKKGPPDARAEGEQAYNLGLPLSSCPYQRGKQQEEWVSGYRWGAIVEKHSGR